MGQQAISIRSLQRAIADRSAEHFHPIDAWSPTDLACCLAGEVGEACNIIKKVRRIDDGEDRAYNKDIDQEQMRKDIGKELADTIIYALLLYERLEMDAEECLRDKYNEVSDRVGSLRKL